MNIWYIDNTALGGGNIGTGWANAFTGLTTTTGIQPGDTVYIAGGPNGSSQTYNISGSFGQWAPTNGNTGLRVTYQIGQDSLHNGTAIFNAQVTGNALLGQPHDINIIGDAGDGQMHFQVQNSYQLIVGSNQSNIHLSYINCPSMNAFTTFNGSNNIEVGHCNCVIGDPSADHACFASFSGSLATDNLIHDCTIFVPNAGPGFGADCFQWNGTGFSIYNNTVVGYLTGYNGGQHQDGWQGTGPSNNVKIYNNIFVNIGNYCLYGDAFGGPFTNLYIYNNLMLVTNPAMATGFSSAVVVGTDGGYAGPLPAIFSGVVISNNVAVDIGFNQVCFALNNATTNNTYFTGCYVTNNISLNCAGIGTGGSVAGIPHTSGQIVGSGNVFIASGNGTGNFVYYSGFAGLLDNLHLISSATGLIGQGMNLSQFFSIDKDGNPRPGSGPWDIGAYQFLVYTIKRLGLHPQFSVYTTY